MIEYDNKKYRTLEEQVAWLSQPGRVPGEKGEPGKDGKDGRDGIGITGATIINENLILTLSNGATINCGRVVGPEGPRGQRGEKGEAGTEYNFIQPLQQDGANVKLNAAQGLKYDPSASELVVDYAQVQGKLIAGSGITISGNTISASGGGGGSVDVNPPLDIQDDRIVLKIGSGLTLGDGDDLAVKEGFGIYTDNTDAVAVDTSVIQPTVSCAAPMRKQGTAIMLDYDDPLTMLGNDKLGLKYNATGGLAIDGGESGTGGLIVNYNYVQHKLTPGSGIKIDNNIISFKLGEGFNVGDDDVIDVAYGDTLQFTGGELDVRYGAGYVQKQFYKHNVFMDDTDGNGVLAFSFLSQSATPCTTVSQVANSLTTGKTYVASGYEIYCDDEHTNVYFKVVKSGGTATAYTSSGTTKQITSTNYTLSVDSVEGIEG